MTSLEGIQSTVHAVWANAAVPAFSTKLAWRCHLFCNCRFFQKSGASEKIMQYRQNIVECSTENEKRKLARTLFVEERSDYKKQQRTMSYWNQGSKDISTLLRALRCSSRECLRKPWKNT